jgi:hypothetical protein
MSVGIIYHLYHKIDQDKHLNTVPWSLSSQDIP